jgi:hypothetical protein
VLRLTSPAPTRKLFSRSEHRFIVLIIMVFFRVDMRCNGLIELLYQRAVVLAFMKCDGLVGAE